MRASLEYLPPFPFSIRSRRLAGVVVPGRRAHWNREMSELMALFWLTLANNRRGAMFITETGAG